MRRTTRASRRSLAGALLAIVSMTALAACSSATQPTTDGTTQSSSPSSDAAPTETGGGATTEKKPLIISLDSPVDLLDPQAWRTPGAMVATGSVVEQLIEQVYDERDGGVLRIGQQEFGPALAESWTLSDDNKTATFKLRPGLQFADGSPLTADDVVWSFRRSLEGPGYVKAFLPMANVTSSDEFRAVDDLTFEINMEHATPLLMNLVGMQPLGILSQESGDEHGTADDPWAATWFHDNENSSGPYVVDSYDPNVNLVFKPNPHYYDQDKIRNGGVTIQFVSDPSQRALLLRSGDIDVAQGIPLDQVQQMSKEPGLKVIAESSNRAEYLGLNAHQPPFDNPKVRQAIAYAIPYQDIVDQVMYGYAEASESHLPSGIPTATADGGRIEQNMDKAAALLKEAGVDGFQSTLYYKQSSGVEQRLAVFIQGSLAELGLTIEVRGIPDAEYTERTRAHELPMYLNNFLGWGADPFYHLYQLAGTPSGTNFTSYSNPEFDALMLKGFQTMDPDERAKISAEGQKMLFDEMPFVPLYSPDWVYVIRDGVSGMTKDNTEQLRLQYLSKE